MPHMIRDTVVAIKRRRLERRTAAVANSTLLEFRPAGISIVSGRAASVVAGEDSVHSNRTHGWNDKLLKWLRAHPEQGAGTRGYSSDMRNLSLLLIFLRNSSSPGTTNPARTLCLPIVA